MQDWIRISLLLCTFGFLKELRPSEPFIADFLAGPWRNVTSDEINRDVFPVGTYSYLAQAVLVFLITDFLRYKPLIIVSGLSGVTVWSMLLWTKSLTSLQILEVFYGTYMATEVAYYTYIYAKVDRNHYQKVTSHTRAAILGGRFIAGVIAQLLVNFELFDYRELNFITLGTQIVATLWAMFLPSVKTSLYFNRQQEKTALVQSTTSGSNISNKTEIENKNFFETAFSLLWSHFKSAYTNKKVLQWSFWYALGMCGYLQVISYVQILWVAIDSENKVLWNGAVEATITLLGAVVSLLAGYLHNEALTQRRSLWVLTVLSILEGGAILLATWTSLRWVSYLGYLLFAVLYSFLITIASAEVAKHLSEDSFGLVFGINTLGALVMQSILTFVCISESGFNLTIIEQYTVYGFYHIILGGVYLISVFINIFFHKTDELTISEDL